MLIRNYGLFWKREDVEWGYQGRGARGRLLGRFARQLRAGPVDFREQQGVYVLYDENFRIVYVGQSGAGNTRLFNRLRAHKRDHLAQRWNRFSWFGILPVVNTELDLNSAVAVPSVGSILDHIEAILLAAAEPPLNLQRGRFGIDVQQYLQHRDEAEDEGEDDDE